MIYLQNFSFFSDKGSELSCENANGGCEQNCTQFNSDTLFCSCNQGFKIDDKKPTDCIGLYSWILIAD